MKHEIVHRPSFSMLKIFLEDGESITAESGAMVYMSPSVEIKTHTRGGEGIGGLLKSVKTSVFGGESFWINTFTSKGVGELGLAPGILGDVETIALKNEGYILQSGAYLASSGSIDIDTKWQGLKGFLGEGDIIMLRASGSGTLFVASFGALEEKVIGSGETLTVDNGHLVAWSDTMNYKVRRVGGLKSTLVSGEGLVIDIVGPGKVLLQSRNPTTFVNWLLPFLPKPQRSDMKINLGRTSF